MAAPETSRRKTMMKRNGTKLALAALGLATLTATASVAAAAPVAAAATGTLSPAEVVSKVEAAGYKNVHDLEFDDGRWEAEATSAQGAQVDLAIDASSGAVLEEHAD
jgi:hypothetical protein